jgi:ribosome-binding protein aMBF1 (putative translation factor)
MNMEGEILAFGETALWVECNLCGRVFGGPGVDKAIGSHGEVNVCVDCQQEAGFSLAIAKPSIV